MAQVIEDKLLKALEARLVTITSPGTPRVIYDEITSANFAKLQENDILLYAPRRMLVEAVGSGQHHWSQTVAICARSVLKARSSTETPYSTAMELGSAIHRKLYEDATQSAIQAVTEGASIKGTQVIRSRDLYYVAVPGKGEGSAVAIVTSVELRWLE